MSFFETIGFICFIGIMGCIIYMYIQEMWFFKKRVSKIDKEEESLIERLTAVEHFYPVGSFIEYLDVKMMVVGHHESGLYMPTCPGLRLQWMDSRQQLQRCFLQENELQLCKIVSINENKEI